MSQGYTSKAFIKMYLAFLYVLSYIKTADEFSSTQFSNPGDVHGIKHSKVKFQLTLTD